MSATPATFAQQWSAAVAGHSNSPFLIFEGSDGEVTEWTYAEFDEVVDRTVGFLVERDVGAGDAVHLALTNSPTFVAVWLAVVKLGAWMVPSDPMGRSQELAGHIDRTLASFGFCAKDREAEYKLAGNGSRMKYLAINESDTRLAWLPDRVHHSTATPDALDRAAVMFTSGTTGRPKGVEVTQANYAFAGEVMAHEAGLGAADRQLVVLPMFHVNSQYYSFASAIAVGASVALMSSFSASRFLSQAARHGVTCASLFAAPIRMILARGGPVDGLVLRHCWFAQNISAAEYTKVTEWFGCAPRQLYGMTETIPAVLTSHVEHSSPDSMGSVSHRCAVEVHDDEGNEVADGEEGEVVVGGEPGVQLFAGYLDDPETTAASFRAGWFLTGDRATRDAEGRHYFAGRHSDVLKVAGENVSTVEIEAVLSEHPSVLEAAVVGAPDAIRDEVPVAFVVAADTDAGVDLHELVAWCQSRLSKVKQPRNITVLDSLPRTSVGKIRKFLLVGASGPSGRDRSGSSPAAAASSPDREVS